MDSASFYHEENSESNRMKATNVTTSASYKTATTVCHHCTTPYSTSSTRLNTSSLIICIQNVHGCQPLCIIIFHKWRRPCHAPHTHARARAHTHTHTNTHTTTQKHLKQRPAARCRWHLMRNAIINYIHQTMVISRISRLQTAPSFDSWIKIIIASSSSAKTSSPHRNQACHDYSYHGGYTSDTPRIHLNDVDDTCQTIPIRVIKSIYNNRSTTSVQSLRTRQI